MDKKKGLLLLIVLCFVMIIGGCGTKVSNQSPESVTKSILNAYQNQDDKAVLKCFGLDSKKKTEKDIKKEINYNLNLFKARGASKIKIEKCSSLGNFNGYDLVYIIYTFEKKNNESKQSEALEIPAVSLYFVQQKEKKYYVVPAKNVTEEMSKISSDEYAKFMRTEEYKSYEMDYKKFIRKNPNYEEELARETEKLLNK